MTTSPGANDLTTVAAVAVYLGQDPAQDADLLQSLVTAASTMIQSYLGFTVAAASYSETRNGNGTPMLYVANRPIVSIQALSISGNAQVASPGYGQAGYDFDDDSIYLTGSYFSRGMRNVQVTYTAGYETVPADLAQACVELTAFRYKLINKSGSGLVSESAMQQTTSYSQRDMPASVATAIEPYRRVFAA